MPKKKSPSDNTAARSRVRAEAPLPDVHILKEGKLKSVPIGLVVPYEKNPRNITKRAVAVVKKSITDFGYCVPIVVDSNMVVVTGHTRLQACKELGMASVVVLIAAHLTEQQAKEFRIVDNRVSELASWDDALLIPELRAVGTEGEMDAFFKDGELQKLVGTLETANNTVVTPTQDQIEKQKTSREKHFSNKSDEDDKKLIPVTCQHCGEGFSVDSRLALK